MRLTYKMNNGEYAPCKNVGWEIFNKLGQVEDKEEEIGVDLVKLLSARKVYYMDWNRNCDGFEIKETYELFINLTKRTIEYCRNEYSDFTFVLELKDYGKNNVYGGWAFTKEELE